jgi:PAS domain S-box-containing protein/putative nucleotidyltransferase with HDIG domain
MKAKDKTQEQPKKEIERLRRRIAALEALETEHKRVEEALQESELQYRTTLNSMGDAIHVIDNDFRFVLFNDAFKRWNEELGLGTDVIGRTVCEVFPFLPDKIGDEYRRVFNTGETLVTEESTKINEREFITETRKIPIFEGGKVMRVVTVVHDVTARRLAEEALRESEEKYRDLVENIDDIIYATDEHGTITYIAPRIEDVGGYATSEIIGRPFLEFVHKEDIPYMRDKFEQDLSGRAEPHEYRAVNKAGKVRWVHVSSRPFFKGTRVVGLRGVLTDITSRKHAEEELERSYRQLRETFIETVNALASTVEMKDPYTAGHQRWVTRLACSIAKEMGLSDERIEGIRMAGLIHDIGKINIPAEILSKPGQLSEIQYNMVKIHAQVGCDILREIKFPWPVAKIVLQHHERWDGSGYPERLSGEEIILEARILAVADTVEAMSSHRPYRVAHGIDSALEEISQNRGTLYDPAVVDVCLTLFEKGFRFD